MLALISASSLATAIPVHSMNHDVLTQNASLNISDKKAISEKDIFDFVSEWITDRTGVAMITYETSLRNDLGLDSLDVYELIIELEYEYAIWVDGGAMEYFETVGDIVKYVYNKISN